MLIGNLVIMKLKVQQNERITKSNFALNKEVFQVKEGEEKQRLENLKLLQNIAELQKLETKVNELTNENKLLKQKYNFEKLTKEKENKIDKVSSQLTSSRSKYASKLKSLELETGKPLIPYW